MVMMVMMVGLAVLRVELRLDEPWTSINLAE